MREAPDIFIVYDGLNEGLGLAGRPDLPNPHYLINRVSDLFELRDPGPGPGTSSIMMGVMKTTGYYRLASSIQNRFLRRRDLEPTSNAGKVFTNDSDIPTVAARSTDILLENYGLMSALGEGEGFPCFFFFQPQPGVGPKPLHESEVQVLADVNDNPEEKWVLEFSRAQREIFRKRLAAIESPDRVYDLSGMFATVTRPLYLDWAHLSHTGNRMVADRIFQIIREQLCNDEVAFGKAQVEEQVSAACRNQTIDGEGR